MYRRQVTIKALKVNVAPSRDSDEIRYVWSPVSITTRYVRLKASKLLLVGHNAKFCLRFELFGCPPVGQILYPVGFQNGIIPDSQFSASSSHAGEPPSHARLNMRNAWCTTFAANQWLQFDLGRVLAVQAIATQGRYGRTSNDMVSSYHISYTNSTVEKYQFFNESGQRKVFAGNNRTGQDPVMNSFIPTIIARYIRIHPLTGGPSGVGGPVPKEFCIRAEIYAKHADCAADISSFPGTIVSSVLSGSTETLTQSLDVYSMQAWCADVTSQLKILRIDLGNLRPVSGIIVSGNPNADSWLTGFNLKLGLETANMNAEGSYRGTIGRTEIAVNWLKNTRIARFLEIEATTFVGHKCFRVRVLGCPKVPVQGRAPVATTIQMGANFVEMNIKVFSAANTTNATKNNTIVVKYTCVNGSDAKPCNNTSQKLLVFKLTNNTNANISGLEPGTSYQVTTQVLYHQSVSEEHVMMITTSMQETVDGITSSTMQKAPPTRSSIAEMTGTISSSTPLLHTSSSFKSLSELYTPVDETPFAAPSTGMSSVPKLSPKKENFSPSTEIRVASSATLHATSYERKTIESMHILVKSKVVIDGAIVASASTPKTAQSVSSLSMASLAHSSFGSQYAISLSLFPSVLLSSRSSSSETVSRSEPQLTTQIMPSSKQPLTVSQSSELSTGSVIIESTVLSVPQILSTTNSIENQVTNIVVSPSSDVVSSESQASTVESSFEVLPTQKKAVSEFLTIAFQSSAKSTIIFLASKPITQSSVETRKSTAEITTRPASNTSQTSLLQNNPTNIETKLPSNHQYRSTSSRIVEISTSSNFIMLLSSTALQDISSVSESVEISPKPSTSIASNASFYSPVMNAAEGLSSSSIKPSTRLITDGYSLLSTDVKIASVNKVVSSTGESSRASEGSVRITSATSSAALASYTTLITLSPSASGVIQPSSLTSISLPTLRSPLSSTGLESLQYEALNGSVRDYSQALGPSTTIVNPSSSLTITGTHSSTVSTEPLRLQPSFSTRFASSSAFAPTSSLGNQSTVLNILTDSFQGNGSSSSVEPFLTYALHETQKAMLPSSFEPSVTMAFKELSPMSSSSKSIVDRNPTTNTDVVSTVSPSPGSRSDVLAASLIEETSHAGQISGAGVTSYYAPCWISYYVNVSMPKSAESIQHVTATAFITQSLGNAVSIKQLLSSIVSSNQKKSITLSSDATANALLSPSFSASETIAVISQENSTGTNHPVHADTTQVGTAVTKPANRSIVSLMFTTGNVMSVSSHTLFLMNAELPTSAESKATTVVNERSSNAVKGSINGIALSQSSPILVLSTTIPQAQSSSSHIIHRLTYFASLSSTNEVSLADASSNVVATSIFNVQKLASTNDLTPQLTRMSVSAVYVTSSPMAAEATTTSIHFVPPLFVINRKRRAVQEGSLLISPSFSQARSVFNSFSTTSSTPALITDIVVRDPSAHVTTSHINPVIKNKARILTSSLGLCLVYETVKERSQGTTVTPVNVTQRTSAVFSDVKTSSSVAVARSYSDTKTSFISSSLTSTYGLQHSQTALLDSLPTVTRSGVSNYVYSTKSLSMSTVSLIPSYTLSGSTLPEGPTTFASVTPAISKRLPNNISYTAQSDVVAISQSIQDSSQFIQGFSQSLRDSSQFIQGFSSLALASSLSIAEIIMENSLYIHRASETSVIMTHLPSTLNGTSTRQKTTLTGSKPTFTPGSKEVTSSLSNQQRLTSMTSIELSQNRSLSFTSTLRDSVPPVIGISNVRQSTSSVSASPQTASFVSLLSGIEASVSTAYSSKESLARATSDVSTMTTQGVANATVQLNTTRSSLSFQAADIPVNNETKSNPMSRFSVASSIEFTSSSTLDSMSSTASTVHSIASSDSEPIVSSGAISVSFLNLLSNTISLQIEPTVSSMTPSLIETIHTAQTQTLSTMSAASVNRSQSNSSRSFQTPVMSLSPSFDSLVPKSLAASAPINHSSIVDSKNSSAASTIKNSSAQPTLSSPSRMSDVGMPVSQDFSIPRQESAKSAVTPGLQFSSIQIPSTVSIKEFASNATIFHLAVSTTQLTDILSTSKEQPLFTLAPDHTSLGSVSSASVLAISPSSSLITVQPTTRNDSVVLSTGFPQPATSSLALFFSNRTEIPGTNDTVLTTLAESSSVVATVGFPQDSDPLKSTIKASKVIESSFSNQATSTHLSVDASLTPGINGTGVSNTIAIQGSLATSSTFVRQSTPASTTYPVSSAQEAVSRGYPASTPAFTSALLRPYESTSSFSTTSRFIYTKLLVSNQSAVDSARESSVFIAKVPSTVYSQFQSISNFAGRTVYSSSKFATSTYAVQAKSTASIPKLSSTVYPLQVQESSSSTIDGYVTTNEASSSSSTFVESSITTYDALVTASSVLKVALSPVTSIRSIASTPGVGSQNNSVAPVSYGASTVRVTSSALGGTSKVTNAIAQSVRPSEIPSSAIIIPERSSFTAQPSKVLITPTPPSAYGLAYVPLQVPVIKDVSSQAYKEALESKIVATYNLLKYKRKRRAVTLAGNTATITILVRRGITDYVDVVFFVMENNVVIAAQRTVDTLNQMTLKALTQRFADTVLGPVVVYGSTTIATTTIVPPTNQQLLGMVLTDSPNNNFTTPNNMALFQKKIADYYRSDGTSNFRVYYQVQEPKNIVYVEMYVKVNSATQAASIVESFFKSKSKAAVSAIIPWTVIAMPYALSHIKSTDANHVKMTVRLVLSNTDVTSLSFKNLMSIKITESYIEAKDGLIGWTKRGSVTTYIVSSTSPSTLQAKIIFFILDKGEVVSATSLVGVFAKLTMSRMSTVLGAEVLSLPALLTALVPTSPPASTSYLWIIGVGVAAFLLILLIIVCLYYRWRHGGYTVKQDSQKVDLPKKNDFEMKERTIINSEYRYPAHYISGTSHGWPDRRSVNFAAPPEEERREREYQVGVRSQRRKIGSRKSTSSNGTRNRGSDGYLRSTPIASPVPQRPSAVSTSKSTHATQTKDPLEETAYVEMQSAPVRSKPPSETYQSDISEKENLYESIKQYAKIPLAAQLPPASQLNYRELIPIREKTELESAAGRAANRRFQKNDIYFSRSALGRLPSIPNGRTSLSSPELTLYNSLEEQAELPTDETTQQSSPDQTQKSSSKQELSKLSDIAYDYRDSPQSLVQYIKQELLHLAHNRGRKTRVTAFENT
eukprot:Seg798.4 transcript_id=Seg798.4/GoldUCD/mRNA.D3Y31 product="hypothetical protein" protein_id=Seg798.4/GoldUCD/D3Y31